MLIRYAFEISNDELLTWSAFQENYNCCWRALLNLHTGKEKVKTVENDEKTCSLWHCDQWHSPLCVLCAFWCSYSQEIKKSIIGVWKLGFAPLKEQLTNLSVSTTANPKAHSWALAWWLNSTTVPPWRLPKDRFMVQSVLKGSISMLIL